MAATLAAPSHRPAPAHPATARILQQARAQLFTHGYSAFTMADLATELGMSKKTLYVHFAGKDEMLRAAIEQLAREIRADADQLLRDRRLNFSGKLRGFAEGMVRRLAPLQPRTVRDIQRFAPELHLRVVELRSRNIPYIFGRFLEEGQRAGMVRTDLDAAFAIEFFLQALNGLLQFADLERLHLAPRDILPRALELFFGGLLTPAGRKEHEKSFAR